VGNNCNPPNRDNASSAYGSSAGPANSNPSTPSPGR
jgi:hypothetical protein